MTDTLVDTNVLLDVMKADPVWFGWSGGALAEAVETGSVVLTPVVYAELAAGFARREILDEVLFSWPVRREHLPWDAAFAAGHAFLQYRRSGGERSSPLPDFFIGAHAAVRGYKLLTRDRGHYRPYFPTLDIITPNGSP